MMDESLIDYSIQKEFTKKEYIVETDKSIKGIDLVKWKKEFVLNVKKNTSLCCYKDQSDNNVYHHNRRQKHQVRRMCAAFGYQVEDLERIRIANITLAGLKPGMFRPFTEKEKTIFMQALGLNKNPHEASFTYYNAMGFCVF